MILLVGALLVLGLLRYGASRPIGAFPERDSEPHSYFRGLEQPLVRFSGERVRGGGLGGHRLQDQSLQLFAASRSDAAAAEERALAPVLPAATSSHAACAEADVEDDVEDEHQVFSASSFKPNLSSGRVGGSLYGAIYDEAPGSAGTVLVCTLDGDIRGVDAATGAELWGPVSTGAPLLRSILQQPSPLEPRNSIIPAMDGGLIFHSPGGASAYAHAVSGSGGGSSGHGGGSGHGGSSGRSAFGAGATLRRLQLDTIDLAGRDFEWVPARAQSGRFYIAGKKSRRLLGLDLRTGELRRSCDAKEVSELIRFILQHQEEPGIVWLQRIDHQVELFDSAGSVVWNATHSELEPMPGLGGGSGARSPRQHVAVAAPDGFLRVLFTAGPGRPPQPWSAQYPTPVAAVFEAGSRTSGGDVSGRGSGAAAQRIRLLFESAVSAAPVPPAAGLEFVALNVLPNGQPYAVSLNYPTILDDGSGSSRGRAGGSRLSDVPALPSGRSAAAAHSGSTALAHAVPRHGLALTGGGGGVAGAAGGGGGALSHCHIGHDDYPACWEGTHPVLPPLRMRIDREAAAGFLADGPAGAVDWAVAELEAGAGEDRDRRYSGPLLTGGESGAADEDARGNGSGGDWQRPRGSKLGRFWRRRRPDVVLWLQKAWVLLLAAVVAALLLGGKAAAKRLLGLAELDSNSSGTVAVTPLSLGARERETPHAAALIAADGPLSSNVSSNGSSSAIVAAAGNTAVTEPWRDAKGLLHVGRLTVSEAVLGYGSHGTIVYRGELEGRPVAVKRMLKAFHQQADREIGLLINCDGHPNVVRYFVKEEAGDFVYLALQLCELSLATATAQIRGPRALRMAGKNGVALNGSAAGASGVSVCAPPELRAALLQLARGVEHLHRLRIVHRDLKPQNILLAPKKEGATTATAAVGAANASAAADAAEATTLSLPELRRVEDLTHYVLMISDMGLGKQLMQGQSSFGASSYQNGALAGGGGGGGGGGAGGEGHSGVLNEDANSGGGGLAGSSGQQQQQQNGSYVGSVGWQAPEVIRARMGMGMDHGETASADDDGSSGSSGGGGGSSNGTGGGFLGTTAAATDAAALAGGGSSSGGHSLSRRTQAVDVFSLGCVFYTCLDVGSHPFGETYERETNIVRAAPRLDPVAVLPDARHLVELMLAAEPGDRPSAAEVCRHPFFWDDDRRLAFLMDLSDRLEQEHVVQSVLLRRIEAKADAVVGRSWDLRLGPELLQHVGRFRKYDYASVRDLLRVVRNKRHHFHELPPHLQEAMSPLPSGLIVYVEKLFPGLLMHCYRAACDCLASEPLFRPYLACRGPPPPKSPPLLSSPALSCNCNGNGAVTSPAASPAAPEEPKLLLDGSGGASSLKGLLSDAAVEATAATAMMELAGGEEAGEIAAAEPSAASVAEAGRAQQPRLPSDVVCDAATAAAAAAAAAAGSAATTAAAAAAAAAPAAPAAATVDGSSAGGPASFSDEETKVAATALEAAGGVHSGSPAGAAAASSAEASHLLLGEAAVTVARVPDADAESAARAAGAAEAANSARGADTAGAAEALLEAADPAGDQGPSQTTAEGEAAAVMAAPANIASTAAATAAAAVAAAAAPTQGAEAATTGDDNSELSQVVVWSGSALAAGLGCRGWWRDQDHFRRRLDAGKPKPRSAHATRALEDPKYRTRLCSHWEASGGTSCPMRKKGKCDFAHGAMELRVKAAKVGRWGKNVGPDGNSANANASGGEDTLGAARAVEKMRIGAGAKDWAAANGGAAAANGAAAAAAAAAAADDAAAAAGGRQNGRPGSANGGFGRSGQSPGTGAGKRGGRGGGGSRGSAQKLAAAVQCTPSKLLPVPALEEPQEG